MHDHREQHHPATRARVYMNCMQVMCENACVASCMHGLVLLVSSIPDHVGPRCLDTITFEAATPFSMKSPSGDQKDLFVDALDNVTHVEQTIPNITRSRSGDRRIDIRSNLRFPPSKLHINMAIEQNLLTKPVQLG